MSEEERLDQENEEEFEGDIPAAQEASLLNLRTLLISVSGLIGMIVFILLVSAGIYIYFQRTSYPDAPGRPTPRVTQGLPQGPVLQEDPAIDLLRIRETEQARLQGYGWVDKDEGWVRIPIERAMELLAENVLPVTDQSQPTQERIEARESGFSQTDQIPSVTPGPVGTPLLEITLPAEFLETETPEPNQMEQSPTGATTQTPNLLGTPDASIQDEAVSLETIDHETPNNPIEAVRYDQKLNNQIPLEIALINEQDQRVRLGDFFGEKPVVLLFAYYECPMLCTLVLNDLTRALRSLDFEIGNQFEVVTISIDPRETSELAAAKKETYLREYGRSGAERGWHFLTGEVSAIQALTEAVGFEYIYDEELDQYAHPTGILILTPEGKIARYLLGIDYPEKDLRLGIVEASSGKIGSPVDQFFLLCYAYDPVNGRYTLVIENVLKVAGGFTVLLLGTMISFFTWRERRRKNLQITINE